MPNHFSFLLHFSLTLYICFYLSFSFFFPLSTCLSLSLSLSLTLSFRCSWYRWCQSLDQPRLDHKVTGSLGRIICRMFFCYLFNCFRKECIEIVSMRVKWMMTGKKHHVKRLISKLNSTGISNPMSRRKWKKKLIYFFLFVFVFLC